MTQLDEGAVNAVALLAKQAATVQQLKIGEYNFADRKLERVDVNPRHPVALEFYTLDGFVRFVLAEAETADAMIHVVQPTLVTAISKLEGQDSNLRREYARAVFSGQQGGGFEFNNYGPLEDLSIALQTSFDPDAGDCRELQKFCSSVRSTASVGVADDGISQAVEARRGVAAVLTTAVKNPWFLAPYRTFPEVAQPSSPYVLRFKSYGEGLPNAALYETGSQLWQVEAVGTLAKYLRVALPDHEILG